MSHTTLLDEFPDLRAEWYARRHPVVDIITDGVAVEPTMLDDLDAEIRLARECLDDPWCPPGCVPLLVAFIDAANSLRATA